MFVNRGLISGLCLVAGMAFSGSARAQATPQELNDRIKLMFDAFQLEHISGANGHAFGLKLDTTDTIDGKDTFYQTWVTWYADKTTKRENFRVQVWIAKNGKVVRRIVGNGETLYSYDFVRNEYSSQAYGRFGGEQPTNYRSNFLAILTKITPAEAQPAVRFAIEVDGFDAPAYQTWMSGVKPTGAIQTNVFVPPVTFLMYDSSRMVKFNPPNVPNNPMSIELLTESVLAGKTRRITSILTEWTVADRGAAVLPTDSDFVFVPPNSARPIANPRTNVQ